MANSAKKKLALCLVAGAAAMLIAASTSAAAEGQYTDKMLQPQGLNSAGIYALRELEPDLTGSGVKFAVNLRMTTARALSTTALIVKNSAFTARINCRKVFHLTQQLFAQYYSAKTLTHITQSLDNSIIRELYQKPRQTFMSFGIFYPIRYLPAQPLMQIF